ncbi:MAG: HlyD family efflux transporter periplasmic adaptor subunit [Planctomycetes bacterium]|nr:HlyD family efflux transporter periplasmic adaptor subunit [Planctomycetota bacterium]
MNWKIGIGLFVAALILVGVGWAFWPGNGNVLRLPGVVEVQEVRLGSKVGGRVESVQVKEGAIITKGQSLVIFEAPELRNQKEQMQARVDAAVAEWERAVAGPRQEEKDAAHAAMESAKARWDRAEYGWRVEEKQQAKSELESAEADFEQANKEFNRVAPLFRQGSESRTVYEGALAARDRARGRKDSALARVEMMKVGTRKEDKVEAEQEYRRAKAQCDLLKAGTRKEDKDVAKAKVDELRAQLRAIGINLGETTLMAPPNLGKAVVEVVAVRPGDLVAPNQPVIRVLRVEDLWIKVYVPETEYGLVTLDTPVDVTIDSHPGKIFKGVVVQRANIAEFTPRNVQSVDERRHQVFGVKIRVDDPQGVLNAGMAAEVTIRVK